MTLRQFGCALVDPDLVFSATVKAGSAPGGCWLRRRKGETPEFFMEMRDYDVELLIEHIASAPHVDVRYYPAGDAKAEQAAREQATKDVGNGKTILLVPEVQPTRLQRLEAACGLSKEDNEILTQMADRSAGQPDPFRGVHAISEAKAIELDLHNLKFELWSRISAAEATLFGTANKAAIGSPGWVTGEEAWIGSEVSE
jgi:hypothetical protein